MYEPESIEQLRDPAFLAWLHANHGSPVRPDPQDFDHNAQATSQEEAGNQYRLAQARKLIRLYPVWKAGAN